MFIHVLSDRYHVVWLHFLNVSTDTVMITTRTLLRERYFQANRIILNLFMNREINQGALANRMCRHKKNFSACAFHASTEEIYLIRSHCTMIILNIATANYPLTYVEALSHLHKIHIYTLHNWSSRKAERELIPEAYWSKSLGLASAANVRAD